MIDAKVIADSISVSGQRITTFWITGPRFLLPELNTHRAFSRSTASSRAIPVRTMIAAIRKNPALPVHWGQNQPGMSAEHELGGWRLKAMTALWFTAMWAMTTLAGLGARLGCHKQIVNRLCEPFAHFSTVVTATQWSNFYALRCHPDAQPEIKALAEAMRAAQNASEPVLLRAGEWHLPFVTQADRDAARDVTIEEDIRGPAQGLRDRFGLDPATLALVAVSVARSARTSYTLHNGRPTTLLKDVGLYQRLLGAVPLHASPAEHAATPDPEFEHAAYHGNFSGFVQYRKLLPGECQ